MYSHEIVVRSALRAGDDIDRLIGRLGTVRHPRGSVLVAYRNAERALRDVLGGRASALQMTQDANEVMQGLRRELAAMALEMLREAGELGQNNARQQAQAQGLDVPLATFGLALDIAAMVAAWLAVVDQQAAAVRALAATGADEDEILGDEHRAGVLRPAPVIAEGARWVASAVTAAAAAYFGSLLGRQGGQARGATGGATGGGASEWYHQAVAAIDERTTDCCLEVHGQVQPLDQPFRLTGEPRYADELDHPPFHWYCRSAEAMLHRSQVGDQFTQEMQEAARAEQEARARTKERVEIHPAHARSRR